MQYVVKKKRRDLSKSYDKNHYTNRKLKKTRQQKNPTENLDNTTIANRLRTVSWNK